MKSIFSAQQKRVLTMCVVMYTAAYVCRLNLSAALETMMRSLDLSMARGGMLQTLFAAIYATGQFVNGSIVDRVNPARHMLIGLTGTAACNLVFSTKILGGGGEDLELTPADIAQLVAGIGGAVIKGKLKPATVKKIVTGLLQSMEVTNLYKEYPETAEGYWKWKEKADALWEKIGPMSDICDQEVVKRLGIK